jgi:Protein of unknown function (DUF3168)
MAIEQGLFKLLASSSNITALIPNDANGNPQIYWVMAPKGAVVPYIVLTRVNTVDTYTMQGATTLRSGLFQVDCYSTNYYPARQISTAVRTVMEPFQGNLLDTNATYVESIFVEKDWDMPYDEGGKGFVFRGMLEFKVWYYESNLVVTDLVEGGTF